MSIYGLTKGTELEKMVKTIMQAEANGTMMYYALARLAKEQGYDDIADELIESANQEAVHAGFYAVLNGKYPQDFWGLLRTVQKAETNGEAQVMAMAEKVRAAGFAEAADEMEIFAKQEGHHGVVIGKILEKYQPEKKAPAGKVLSALSVVSSMKGISMTSGMIMFAPSADSLRVSLRKPNKILLQ